MILREHLQLTQDHYKVSGDYIHHKQQPNKWVKLSKHSKEMFIQEIHTLPLVPKKKSENVVISENGSVPKQGHLSVSLKESGLPVDVFQGIWSKTLKLVTEEGQITMAPGLPSSRMVASESNPQKPHLVMQYKNGKLTCHCLNYKTKEMCAHTLATAEKLGVAKEFISWHQKFAQKLNLWKLAKSSGVPKNAGKTLHYNEFLITIACTCNCIQYYVCYKLY